MKRKYTKAREKDCIPRREFDEIVSDILKLQDFVISYKGEKEDKP